MFDTKIAIVLRNDLAPWQELNVTAFLTSGIVAQYPAIIGEPYRDAAGNVYNGLSVQPMVVLSAGRDEMPAIHRLSLERAVTTSIYVEEMFDTGQYTAKREILVRLSPEHANVVGLAVRAATKTVQRHTTGAQMHDCGANDSTPKQ